MANKMNENPDKFPALSRWLLATESTAVRKKMIIGLAIFCALLALGDLLYHRHADLEIEGWFNFYSVAGFVSFAFIIYATKFLKKLLSRPEDYYGEGAVDSEEYPPHKLGLKEYDNG